MITWNVNEILVLILFNILLVWYVTYLWKRRKLYMYSRNVPGPFALPIIGSAYLFLHDVTPTGIVNTMIRIQTRFSKLCKFWHGPKLMYFIMDPRHIEIVLTSRHGLDKKDFLYKSITDVIGPSILTAPVIKWKKNRRLIMPAFGQKILDTYVCSFSQRSHILCEQLNKYVGCRNFDLFSLVSKCTLEITLESTLGIQLDFQTTDNNFPRQLDRILQIIATRTFSLWYNIDIIFKLSQLKKERDSLVKAFRSVISTVIEEKLEQHRHKMPLTESETEDGKQQGSEKRSNSFLDVTLGNFTSDEIMQEIELFVVAANDTTAASLTFLFEVLGLFQDVQQKVYEEVIEVLGKHRDVQPSDLSKLKYTERVIKENLRLFPVIPMFDRNISEDMDLGDAILPEDSTACIFPIYVHRHPKYWPDPLKFDPDRFLPEEVAKRHACAFIPFSYGPRNCIGLKYAMMNMKSVVSNVIRRFKIFTEYKSIEEMQLSFSLFLRLQNGSKVFLESRC